jgi:V/A-type H+/Na+-transporting ATPase subunit I
MIVPMQRVTLLCTGAGRDAALARLQDLGVLHIDTTASDAVDLHAAQVNLQQAEKALRLVQQAAAQPDAGKAEPCSGFSATRHRAGQRVETPPVTVAEILKRARDAESLEAEIDAIDDELSRYQGFGEFDPGTAATLVKQGRAVQLFRAQAEALPRAEAGSFVQILRHEDHHVLGVAIGPVELGEKTERIPLPARPLSAARARRAAACVRHANINRSLAAMARKADPLRERIRGLTEFRDFMAAQASMGRAEGLVWLTGYCPNGQIPALQTAAREAGWGLLARNPAPDEDPPTLVRPPKIARPVNALFAMLGILPGYRESDISVVFLAFFTIFFAMLVGDAGYGALLLLGTLVLRRTMRKAPAAPFILMSIFSTATMIWGFFTATYFGIPGTALPGALYHPAAQWLGCQQNIMQFCFFLGALHLSVARLWNAASLSPSRKMLAQLGWVGIIWTMYAAACSVSVEGFAFPSFMGPVAGLSTLVIALFMLDRGELKTRGVDLGMLPLNIVSSLGDIISYVRLFAVGMASVKVAENFNQMALSLSLPLWAKIPAMLLILLAGHGLNLMMGALSILVHAVRLNTLEFSSHKGVSWSGFAYRPFRRQMSAAAEAGE